MERPVGDMWDTLEKLPPASGAVRTPRTERAEQLRSSRLRAYWYIAAAFSAIVGAGITVAVYRSTGAYYPFVSGFAMMVCLTGGFGPSLVAGFGSLLLSHLFPPAGAMLPTATAELIRLSANGLLLLIVAVLAGMFRRSRISTIEREAKLERAAAAVRELLDEATDIIALTDSELRVTYVNARAERMLGFAHGEVLGRSVTELITPESLARAPLQMDALTSGQSIRAQRSVFRADGSTIDVDIAARMLSGGRLLASLRDISEAKRIEERQRAERDLLDGILATSIAGIIIVDHNGAIIFANERAERLLDLTKISPSARPRSSWVYERPRWRLVDLDGGAIADEALPFRRVMATEAPVFDVRLAALWPNGRRLAMSVNGGPLRDATGQLKAAVLAINDITEALDRERALREHDRRIEQITSAMPGMVYQYVMDADGRDRFLYVSNYSRTLIDRDPEALIRDASIAWSLLHPDDLASTRASVRASFETMQPWTHEFRLRDARVPGGWRWISGRAFAQPGPEHGSVQWNGIFVDITERRVFEDNLRQSQKIESVGRLAGSIAHDFNNLLTVILGQSEMLAFDIPEGTTQAESVAQIRAAAESGSALTRQLLGFARRQVVAPQVIDVNTLALRVPPLLGRLLGTDIALAMVLADDPPRVRVDPAQFDQVLVNLVVNARDAMPNGGRVELRTRLLAANAPERADYTMLPAGPVAEISVHDTGVGMTDEVRDRAFEPFFTTKGVGKGTGLGLATSYGIVSQASGTIVIDSITRRGTTVRVLLPVTNAEVTPLTPSTRALPQSGDETLLVVDDDDAVRAVTVSALRRQGYRVLEAAGGQDALEVARSERGSIHVLVTDVLMPKMNGPALAAALVRDRPGLRVLYVSGYAEGAMSQDGVLDAGVDLLQKPYDIGDLARRVRALLENTR